MKTGQERTATPLVSVPEKRFRHGPFPLLHEPQGAVAPECLHSPFSLSNSIKRDKVDGTTVAEFAVFCSFSLIFADFRCAWRFQHLGGAAFRRKPQETADFCRKLQEITEFCSNPFVPFSFSFFSSLQKSLRK